MDTVKQGSTFRWQFPYYCANHYLISVDLHTDLGLLWVANAFYYSVPVFLFK